MSKKPRLSKITEEKKQGDYPGYPYYVSPEEVAKQDEPIEDLPSEKEEDELISETIVPEEVIIDPYLGNENVDFEDEFSDLESEGLNLDGGDDEQLAHRTSPVDFAASDLDIPGSELDDESEAVGSEDEENNSYSLGGDDHNDLEESKP